MRLPEADHLRKVSERDEAEWVLDGARMQIVMKWKCSHCGNRSASKENFCSYCGARMTNAKGLDADNKGQVRVTSCNS